MLKWFQNYLTDHWHHVKGISGFSEWRSMRGGTPQGSALGLLLFLINDLPSQVPGGILLQTCSMLMILRMLIYSAPNVQDVEFAP